MATDIRHTNWVPFGHHGYSHYRIWQEFNGRDWFQRHEWKRDDGSLSLDDWIPGAKGWCIDAQPIAA